MKVKKNRYNNMASRTHVFYQLTSILSYNTCKYTFFIITSFPNNLLYTCYNVLVKTITSPDIAFEVGYCTSGNRYNEKILYWYDESLHRRDILFTEERLNIFLLSNRWIITHM